MMNDMGEFDRDNMIELTSEQIEFLDSCTNEWKFNEETGLVDCDSFRGFGKELEDFKGIKFGRCKGDFDCSNNKLRSLEGCPEEIYGFFDCRINKITTLKGGPKFVEFFYNCGQNELTNLDGYPESTDKGGSFYCYNNKLNTLDGFTKIIEGNFDCSCNELTSLVGCPEIIGASFCCNENQLTTLNGGPKEIGSDLNCSMNSLTSFEGFPEKIGGNLYIDGNDIKNFDYLFNIDFIGHIILNLGRILDSEVLLIKAEIDKGLSYKDALLKSWKNFTDITKRYLAKDLKNEGLGKTIKTINKFGMNI